MPWLGYFHKISQADVFVFLDDVQYTKNSYINRVQIASGRGVRWLTVPVSYRFGNPICAVGFASDNWKQSHLDLLRQNYRNAACFSQVWDDLNELYRRISGGDVASANGLLIKEIAARLDLKARFALSSQMNCKGKGDERLIEVVQQISPGATYLSGRGGAKYQDPSKFDLAGVTLKYLDFDSPAYPQGQSQFVPGLSVLDAIFHLGWAGTARLLHRNAP